MISKKKIETLKESYRNSKTRINAARKTKQLPEVFFFSLKSRKKISAKLSNYVKNRCLTKKENQVKDKEKKKNWKKRKDAPEAFFVAHLHIRRQHLRCRSHHRNAQTPQKYHRSSFTEFYRVFFSTPRMHLSSVSRRMSNQTQLYRVLLGFLDSGFASKFASFFIDFLDRIEWIELNRLVSNNRLNEQYEITTTTTQRGKRDAFDFQFRTRSIQLNSMTR